MRALIQRVRHAQVCVDKKVVGSCDRGFLIFLGVGTHDTADDACRLWDKIFTLRIFDDGNGKMNRALSDVGGGVLIVSQFTLYADCRRGRRPSFSEAAPPAQGESLYQHFCALAETSLGSSRVGRGIFGADMHVTLTNDGPVTLWLDTDELARPRHA